MSQINPKLSLSQRSSFSSSRRSNIPVIRFFYFEEAANHFCSVGKLSYDIKEKKLKYVAIKKTEMFMKKYEGKNEIEINRSEIKNVKVTNDEKLYYLLVELHNKDKDNKNNKIVFTFDKDPNKNNEKIRDKFEWYLTTDYFTIYKYELRKMNIITQKKISFLMKNKDLLILYKRLIKFINDPERIMKYIRYLHPEKININFGFNKIQLSRDEELIMSIQLSQKKFNINKLISSDSDIYKYYYKEMEKNPFKFDNKEFWTKFYNNQKDNKTYLVGEYNPFIFHSKDKNEMNEIDDNNLYEELEKDKYYYDTYESNYLYSDNEDIYKSIKSIKETVNNYSMNKMKDINYFSYSPNCINIYKNKPNTPENRINKRLPTPSINKNLNQETEMEIENENNIDINNIKRKKGIQKAELSKKISSMKKEYEEGKKNKINFNNRTIKTIIEERNNLCKLAYIMNSPNNKSIDKDIYNRLSMIKDLSIIYKFEMSSLDKIRQQQNRYEKIQQIKNEMVNIYHRIKDKKNEFENNTPIPFLLKYAEYNSLN